MEQEFSASEISTIEISTETIYHIKITSEKTNTIKIKTHIEGEHYENVVLNMIEKEGTLQIDTSFSPFFKTENDKLAAHKVIAIEIELIVPEEISIKIEAEIASVETYGKFKNISVLLENGNCKLQDFLGNAMLKTKQGFIEVYAENKMFARAISKKGTVINELLNRNKNASDYQIEAESLSGDISLYQIHE